MDLKISETFRNLIPPLQPDEHKLLEESILNYGYDTSYPIIIWNNTLIDGHNRYEICQKHNVPFTTSEKQFDNEHDVINWIIDNQLARRNINADQRFYLIGKRYQEEKKEHGGDRNSFDKLSRNIDESSPHNEDLNSLNTAQKIAKQHQVSHATVERAEKFANAVDTVAENVGINPREILSGEINASRRDIQRVSKCEPAIQRRVFEKVENKEFKNIKDAVKKVEKEELDEINSVEQVKPIENITKCELGTIYKLGNHLLYCGSNSDGRFIDILKEHRASFAFADPPYNADAADWDHSFEWDHDWLMNYAPVVAVTPGIVSIHDFMNSTTMPYKWSVSCWINNGMTRGAFGFGNWIYTAVFSNKGVFCNSQDFLKVTISNSETKESNHKGRKPASLIAWLFERFSTLDDYIIDPFLGSGTSLLVAEKMKRRCIGAEQIPRFCEHIISRWEQSTGEKASIHEN